MSPFLTPHLAAQTLKVKSMIENNDVHVLPRTCPGEVTLSQSSAAVIVVFADDGTKLFFVHVCVVDVGTGRPICGIYCLNIHRVFMLEARRRQGKGTNNGTDIVDLSPTALEVLGGRAGNRKWRVSLRVADMKNGTLIVGMGLGKWLDRMNLEGVLPTEAMSRTGSQVSSRVRSKQASRNPTPHRSPTKRTKMGSTISGVTTSSAIEDEIVDAFARQARVVSSGDVLWQFCETTVAFENRPVDGVICGETKRDAETATTVVSRCVAVRETQNTKKMMELSGAEERDTDSDDVLIFLPSLVRPASA